MNVVWVGNLIFKLTRHLMFVWLASPTPEQLAKMREETVKSESRQMDELLAAAALQRVSPANSSWGVEKTHDWGVGAEGRINHSGGSESGSSC